MQNTAGTASTPTNSPPTRVSDEATAEGLRLAAEAGNAYRRQVEHFITRVASWGAKQRAGDYEIGLAVEEAEPLYHLVGGSLTFHQPFAGANAHLEVVAMDAADGRFVPGLDVHVQLWNGAGHDLGVTQLPFLWHPTMYHYGANVQLPDGGTYRARVTIERPSFARHDQVNGRRYAEPVVAEFTGVHVKSGRK